MAKTGETKEIDHGYKKLMRELRHNVKGSFVDVGIYGGTNPRGKSILFYAITNEFGHEIVNPRSGGSVIIIPARPFMRTTADENRSTYQRMLEDGLSRIAHGIDTTKGVLTRVGVKVRGDVKKKIRSGPWEPNAPATIERKKSSRPLIDSGTMRDAVEFKLGQE